MTLRRWNKLVPVLAVLAFLLVSVLPSLGNAQAGITAAERVLSEFTDEADKTDAALERTWLDDVSLDEMRARIEQHREKLSRVLTIASEIIDPLQAELDALGPVPEDGSPETPEVNDQRQRLTEQIAEGGAILRRGQQAMARATALTDRLNRERRDRFAQNLMRLGPSPVHPDRLTSAWKSIGWQIEKITTESAVRIRAMPVEAAFERLGLPLVLAIIAILLGVVVRRLSIRWLLDQVVHDDVSLSRQLAVGVGVTLARLLVPAISISLVLTGVSASGILGPTGETALEGLVVAATIVIGVYALSGAYFAPNAPHLRISSLRDAGALMTHRCVVTLAIVVGFDRLLVGTGREIGINIAAMTALNAMLLCVGGMALWGFIRCARIGVVVRRDDDPDDQDEDSDYVPLYDRSRQFVRFVGFGVALISPILALAGYFGASRFLFYPPVMSGALISLCVLIYNVVQAGSLTVRRVRMGKEEEGAGLVPVFIGFLLCVAAVPALAMIWGADGTDISAAWTRVLEGFVVGSTRISPVDFVIFAVVFVVGYILTKLLQGILRRAVLPLTRLDTGAQAAALAGVGYVGVVVSALIAISTTGLDLSNIAIVAGALTVGIGFGLQNIVNNFVSGIILLIERPIKTGDWVEISGVHGTVQQVNVRSTAIQTFDRSTMFVPNADLISGTVTNWTHGNSQGRIIVRVGVSYGSDARRVEKILLDIARGHAMLLRRPEPYVIFAGFGDSSLDFEIRGVLRDVNWILNVGSDLRFSIYERFTEEGIEIPFAQSDITIRNLSELGDVLGAVDAEKGSRA
ncbi:MAG: DUF3772 domain-containing protein [Pseudomonadota bacterium]